MDLYTRLQERRQQLHAAEIHAAELRGVVRGMQMVAKRHPLQAEAEAQERAAAEHAAGLRQAVAELEAIIAELQAAQTAQQAQDDAGEASPQ